MNTYRAWYKFYNADMEEWETGEWVGKFKSIQEAGDGFTNTILKQVPSAEVISIRKYKDGHFEDE